MLCISRHSRHNAANQGFWSKTAVTPIRATWSFFWTSKTTFCVYDRKIFFDDDNDGCNDNYDDNFGNFDDNYDKNN